MTLARVGGAERGEGWAVRACWASAVEGRSGRQLGRGGEQPTREREGVGSWAALVGAGPRGRGLRTGLGQQERGSGFGFGFSPHGLGCFGFWVS